MNPNHLRGTGNAIVMLFVGVTVFIYYALHAGCGGATGEVRTAYAVEQARCLANERAIIAREGTTREQDEADYAAEQARCDAELVRIGGAP
jgi:hypothetical protein